MELHQKIKEELDRKTFEDIINVCKLQGMDYLKQTKEVRMAILGAYIEGARMASNAILAIASKKKYEKD